MFTLFCFVEVQIFPVALCNNITVTSKVRFMKTSNNQNEDNLPFIIIPCQPFQPGSMYFDVYIEYPLFLSFCSFMILHKRYMSNLQRISDRKRLAKTVKIFRVQYPKVRLFIISPLQDL